ncbi:tail fiber domain-containing protein [candidate division KSB1 bacterium]|nr:tail fiber domain-containing protein [candidate division KSB1 bacterium]NIV68739.1 hypothetical protein [Phycisphaerae bacterium]NIS25458.1 tail fiber domain-containing protein [candidate division KSB1 bacterium]NIT72350.1 tail fiber domain-containing protein [candidate division KSB1 bacterium]NIU26135.1 tail fiber domain-containing protein [candidate division KSB1 bacterium]
MSNFFGGGSTTTVQQLDPVAQQVLQSIISQTQGLQMQNPPFVQPFDAAQVAGLQRLQDRPQSTFIPTAEQNLNATLGGDFFGADPSLAGFNPALQGARDAIAEQVGQQVEDQFSLAGRTGSQAQAATTSKAITQALAPFEFSAFENDLARQQGAFQNERQRQIAGLSLLPTVEGVQDSQARRLFDVGSAIQQQNQATLTEPLQSFEFFLNPLLAAAGGFPISSNVSKNASGAQIASGIGGILGSLGGLFCDIRLKQNVKPTGETFKGVMMYNFEYIPELGVTGTFVGPMAHEVEELYPEMVMEINGFKAIKKEFFDE